MPALKDITTKSSNMERGTAILVSEPKQVERWIPKFIAAFSRVQRSNGWDMGCF